MKLLTLTGEDAAQMLNMGLPLSEIAFLYETTSLNVVALIREFTKRQREEAREARNKV